MKVKCKSDEVGGKESPFPLQNGKNQKVNLTIGRSYEVYGVALSNGIICYLLVGDHYTFYPVFVPSACFEAPVGALPPGLFPSFGIASTENSLIIGPKDFVGNSDYYVELVDGESSAVEKWKKFKLYVDSFSLQQEYSETLH